MSPDHSVLYLARLVLETTTPLSISSGNRDAAFDTLLVRDANGLPAIPGSSVAGVLRTLFAQEPLKPDCETVFGFAEGEDGMPSRVHVSWGAIHDATDRPVEGLHMGNAEERLRKDPILSTAATSSPVLRDHVRLHHRGAGDHQGKFDRTALHRGHRFSMEISLWSEGPDSPRATYDDEIWDTLLGLFNHPGFRLGGHTRRGLGAVKLVRAHQGRFDLTNGDDFARHAKLSNALADTTGLAPVIPKAQNPWLQCKLTLTPEEGWRFGQGDRSLTQDIEKNEQQKDPDLLPVTEACVRWDKKLAYLDEQPRVLIPASGVKGALAHRVAFHADCIGGDWASQDRCALGSQRKGLPPPHPVVAALLGYAKDKDNKEEEDTSTSAEEQRDRGRAGWLFLDDAWLDQTLDDRRDVHRQWHNAIDRFTGGVRNHVLYGEELVWRNTLNLTLRIDPRAEQANPEHSETMKEALHLALTDLTEGRLAIGGGSGKGHGYCQGSVEWSDGGTWIGDIR
ncbi:MAG: RAMP superfamily CRISPR-associated protein [Gammaproteobacteria bacterium]